MPTVNEVIVSNSDDGVAEYEEYYGGGASCNNVDSSHQRIRFRGLSDYGDKYQHWEEWRPYLRFQTIDIPQGATITQAKIQLAYHSDNGNAVGNTVTIRGEATDDASSAASSCSAFGSATRTTASVDWSFSSGMSAGTFYDTPDIKTIVQEIVSRAGWSADNDMQFFFEDLTYNNSNNWLLQFRSKNYSGTTYTPKLVITYFNGEQFTPPAAGADIDSTGPTIKITLIPTAAASSIASSLGNLIETFTPTLSSIKSAAVLGDIKVSLTPSPAQAEAGTGAPTLLDKVSPSPASIQSSCSFTLTLTISAPAASASTEAVMVPQTELVTPSAATAKAGLTKKGEAYSGLSAALKVDAAFNILWPDPAGIKTGLSIGNIKETFSASAAEANITAHLNYRLHTPPLAGIKSTGAVGAVINSSFAFTPAVAIAKIKPSDTIGYSYRWEPFKPAIAALDTEAFGGLSYITGPDILAVNHYNLNLKGVTVFQDSLGNIKFSTGYNKTSPVTVLANAYVTLNAFELMREYLVMIEDEDGNILAKKDFTV